jgi:transcriptional regulator with XRE-family HTH domain
LPKKLTPIDAQVCKNLRIYRLAKGLSQATVGDAIGVAYQQVQKYENGINKISPGNLAKLSVTLGVPIERFFEDAAQLPAERTDKAVADFLKQPYATRLLRALAKIRSNKKRLAVVQLAEAMAKAS